MSDERQLPDRKFLLQAFIAIGSRWDGDLDSNLADPIKGKFLVAYARRIEAGYPPIGPGNSPKLRDFSGPKVTNAVLPLDRKRLASGEREDD